MNKNRLLTAIFIMLLIVLFCNVGKLADDLFYHSERKYGISDFDALFMEGDYIGIYRLAETNKAVEYTPEYDTADYVAFAKMYSNLLLANGYLALGRTGQAELFYARADEYQNRLTHYVPVKRARGLMEKYSSVQNAQKND